MADRRDSKKDDDIRAYEEAIARIEAQPADKRSMTHRPSKPRRDVVVDFLGRDRHIGSAPYDVAESMSDGLTFFNAIKTAPLYFAGPPGFLLGASLDMAEGLAGARFKAREGDYLGAGFSAAGGALAPLGIGAAMKAVRPGALVRGKAVLPALGGAAGVGLAGPEIEAAVDYARGLPPLPAPRMNKGGLVTRFLDKLGLFSRAREEAARLPQDKGTPEQMRSMLLKAGVKPDELRWTGFDDWAKGKKSVTKAEVEDFLRQNEVQVGERVLGGTPQRAHEIRQELAALPETPENFARERELLGELDRLGPIPTKFDQYTLPGGENYREVLLTRPGASARYRADGDSVIDTTTGEVVSYGSGAAEIAAGWNARETGAYRSSHWSEPNVLAHLRMKDRVDPEGRRVLHLEELQSDWAQQGRKQGFRDDRALADYELNRQALRQRVDETEAAVLAYRQANPNPRFEPGRMTPREHEQILAQHEERMRTSPEFAPMLQQMREAREQLRDLQRAAPSRSGLPSAPFVDSTDKWTALGLKRALREAAEGGYDALAWTPGREQAKRYDLSKQLSGVEYHEPSGTFSAFDPSGRKVISQSYKPEQLPDVVGKDVAERLMKAEPGNMGVRSLSGLDLQVGGEGMIGYYDKIVPAQLQKLAKTLDPNAPFGTLNIPTGDDTITSRGISHAQFYTMTPEQRRAAIEASKPPSQSLPSLTITPAMREKIKQGLPLFTMAPAAAGLPALTSGYGDEPQGFEDGGFVAELGYDEDDPPMDEDILALLLQWMQAQRREEDTGPRRADPLPALAP